MRSRVCVSVFLICIFLLVGTAFAGADVYVVNKGDTIWDIARKLHMSVKELISLNGLKHPDRLKPGQKLKVIVKRPASSQRVDKKVNSNVYVMKPGDTLWDIARRYGVSIKEIMGLNNIKKPVLLRPGCRIVLPDKKVTNPKKMKVVKVPKKITSRTVGSRKKKALRYVVKKGDTLWYIAHKYHLRVADLMVANNIVNPSRLRPGDILIIGTGMLGSKKHSMYKVRYIHYRLRPGDNPWIIASRFHVDFYALLRINHIKSPRLLQIGQLIKIPVKPGMKFSRVVYTPHKGYRTKMSGFLRRISSLSRHVGEGKFIWPTSGRITSGFGWRRNPFRRYMWEFHPGIDIATYLGKSVVAADRGKVVYSGWMAGYGRIVIIDHGGGWITTYGHLHRIYVRKGQWVYRGQRIGSVGSTGRSTGPHLFFEVYYKGKAVNPLRVLRSRYVSVAKKGDNG